MGSDRCAAEHAGQPQHERAAGLELLNHGSLLGSNYQADTYLAQSGRSMGRRAVSFVGDSSGR